MRSLHLFLDLLAHWWHRLTSSRYVLSLEARVHQLEQDNAGLRDTVFGLRGLPPMPRGVPASFTSSTAAPLAALEPQGIKPKIDAILASRAETAMRERQEKIDQQKIAKAAAADVMSKRNAFLDAVKEERDRAAGKGYATDAAGGVHQVQDPTDPEESEG